MSADDEKDPPVPADLEGKIPRKVHDDQATKMRTTLPLNEIESATASGHDSGDTW